VFHHEQTFLYADRHVFLLLALRSAHTTSSKVASAL
jgi:hypothetical protein